MFGLRRWRRQRLRRRPFPPAWRSILERNVAWYALLDSDDRRELEGWVQIFLHEKRFEGCGGLEIDDEIRVTIAGEACLLLLHRSDDVYPGLVTILVYPSTYVAKERRSQPDGTVAEVEQPRLGQSWGQGSLVLAWDAALRGAAGIEQGHDVVLHEFAHQLDRAEAHPSGAPVLPRRAMYAAWARVLGREYVRLVQDVALHRPNVLPAYGATSPAEFFAVATECFFGLPVALEREHPELYAQLRLFYRQDPAARLRAAAARPANSPEPLRKTQVAPD
jgi:Mlc titration factor MtfA (ptsG expression regulator)